MTTTLDISNSNTLQKRFVKIFESETMNNCSNDINNLTEFCIHLFSFFNKKVVKYGYNNCFVFSPQTVCMLRLIYYGKALQQQQHQNQEVRTEQTKKFIIDNITLNISLTNGDVEDCNWHIKITLISDYCGDVGGAAADYNNTKNIQHIIFAVRKNYFCHPIQFYYQQTTENAHTAAAAAPTPTPNKFFAIAPNFCVEFPPCLLKRAATEEY